MNPASSPPPPALYADQSARDLRLSITRGIVDASQFTIIATKKARYGALCATLHILGESHCVVIEDGQRSFSETLSCADTVRQPDGHSQQSVAFEGGDSLALIADERSGPSYRTRVDIVNYDPALEDALLAEEADATLLSHAFPGRTSEGPTPLTVIRMRMAASGELSWDTLHAYPQEGKMAISHSVWRCQTL